MLARDFSLPNRVVISVCLSIRMSIWKPKVSYKGTEVIPSRLRARSVITHSSLLIEQMPATFRVI